MDIQSAEANVEKQQHSSPEESAQLFHLLLTFAIRMGFTIGHTDLNENRVIKAQIHLDKFVKAQYCVEKMHPNLNTR
jgi:hypothetical protein